MLDDEYSRLYVVLGTWWCDRLSTWQHRVLVLACWSEFENDTGLFHDFGDGVSDDTLMGSVELPANMWGD